MFLFYFQGFFDTAIEYSKLEKVEIGGLNGRYLGSKVANIFDEFNTAFNVFRGIAYDPADPEDDSFIEDYKLFSEKVLDMDRRLAAISTLAIGNCYNLEAIFRVNEFENVIFINNFCLFVKREQYYLQVLL